VGEFWNICRKKWSEVEERGRMLENEKEVDGSVRKWTEMDRNVRQWEDVEGSGRM
jgi:hypothetical protein